MSNALKAKNIIIEKLQESVRQFEIEGKPFQFKNEGGDLLNFEASEIKVCLNQMEDELSIVQEEPFDYLKWNISVPFTEANEGRYFNVRKIDLIEALINYCFGVPICEGSFKPGVVISANYVAGAVYIYKNGIDKIVGVLEQSPVTENNEISTVNHTIETSLDVPFNSTVAIQDNQEKIEEIRVVHSPITTPESNLLKSENAVGELTGVDTKKIEFQDGTELNDKSCVIEREEHYFNDTSTNDLQKNRIRDAALTAINNYLDWSEKGNKHRGANGWLTWFRHGQYGQVRANNLKERLEKNPSLEEIQIIINGFLQNKNTRFNQHSLASFLLDELSVIEDSPWQDMSQYPEYRAYEEEKNSAYCWPF